MSFPSNRRLRREGSGGVELVAPGERCSRVADEFPEQPTSPPRGGVLVRVADEFPEQPTTATREDARQDLVELTR